MAVEPTDEDLIAFARLLIGDTKTPYLDPARLAEAVSENRELWVKLYKVNEGLEDLELPPPVD